MSRYVPRLQGRWRSERANQHCKLSWTLVKEMRLLARTMTGMKVEKRHEALAARYGVSARTVRDVLQNETWVERSAAT
jgi:hypothetical protein